MILRWIKKHWVLAAFLFIFLYMVIGATAPFYHYKPVSDITKAGISAADFYQDGDGVDRAMILETNQSAWDERMRLMGLAQERIILSTFDFRDGESPRDIMAVMLHKADEGVRVQILVDGFSGLVRMERNRFFYALSSHPNIEIRLYNKMNFLLPWRTQGRMHDKYVIADDYGYILGGRNTFDYFIGSYPTSSRSHDREVLVYNTANGTGKSSLSSLNQVTDYFNRVWDLEVSAPFHEDGKLAEKAAVMEAADMLRLRYDALAVAHPELLGWDSKDADAPQAGGSPGHIAASNPDFPDSPDDAGPNGACGTLPGQPSCPAIPIDASINDDNADVQADGHINPLDYYEIHTVPTGKITLVSNPTTIYGKEPTVFYTMTELMKHAEEQVVIHTPYAVFNDTMYDALSQVTRQVPVTMMINSVENGDNFFASSDYPRHKKDFIDTGMEILEYDGGLSYHGKSLLIDDELCAIGSYNFDLRSTYLDTELMLVIQSPRLTAQLKGYMDTYQADCRRLLPDGTYEVPGHITIAPVPLYKRAAWRAVGFLMQPFRFLI